MCEVCGVGRCGMHGTCICVCVSGVCGVGVCGIYVVCVCVRGVCIRCVVWVGVVYTGNVFVYVCVCVFPRSLLIFFPFDFMIH